MPYKINFKLTAICLMISSLITAAYGIANEEKEHEALRALKGDLIQAINAMDIDALAGHMAEKFTFIGIDQSVITNKNELEKMRVELFEATDAPLKKMVVQAEAAAKTTFINDQVGIVYGTSETTYTLANDKVVVVPSKWTATVVKHDDDSWKMATFHSGVNALDNPILDGLKSFWIKVSAGILIGGILLGFIMGRMSRGKN